MNNRSRLKRDLIFNRQKRRRKGDHKLHKNFSRMSQQDRVSLIGIYDMIKDNTQNEE